MANVVNLRTDMKVHRMVDTLKGKVERGEVEEVFLVQRLGGEYECWWSAKDPYALLGALKVHSDKLSALLQEDTIYENVE